MLTRGQNTNNICEASIKVLKSNILQRTKAYSVVQLFHILAVELDNYYQNKILDVANGRAAQHLKKNTLTAPELKKFAAKECGMHMFIVKNLNNQNQYLVQTDIGVCSCPVGQSGAPCKHQKYVHAKYNILLHIIPPCDAENRKLLFYVATGKNVSADWFQTLQLPETSATKENADNFLKPSASRSTSGITDSMELASTSEEILPHNTDVTNKEDFDSFKKETVLKLKIIIKN